MGIDVDKVAAEVIGTTAGASVKAQFKLDTVKYSWVKDYIREMEARHKILQCQDEINKTNKLPAHKGELRELFENSIRSINQTKKNQLIEHLRNVQDKGDALINEYMINERKYGGTLFNPTLINLNPSDIDEIFSELQEGVSQKEKEKTINSLRNEITEIEKMIADKLSPRERWYYRDNGLPEPYPGGCRWTAFVGVWEKVSAKFKSPVDIEGCALTTKDQFRAHYLLGLENIPKRPPLREPMLY